MFEPFLSLFKQGLSGAHCSNLARSIIGAEDEDFENDLDQVSHLEMSVYWEGICWFFFFFFLREKKGRHYQ